MADDEYLSHKEGTNLPDLPDETVEEQLVLMQKLFRCNELFIKWHEETKQWLLSPEHCGKYPKHSMKNKYGYQKRALKYTYNAKDCKLYRKITCSDGIGE